MDFRSTLFIPFLTAISAFCFAQTGQLYEEAYSLVEEQNYSGAIEKYRSFIQEEKSTSDPDQEKISESMNNIGTCYHILNNYPEAIRWYFSALEIDRELGNIENISTRFSNIGFAYRKLGMLDSAMLYYKRALELDRQIGNGTMIAKTLNNLGTLFHQLARYDSTIYYFEQSLTIKKDLNDSAGMAITLNNIGMVYNSWQKYDKAIEYLTEAIRLDSLTGNVKDMARRLNNIGMSYHEMTDYHKAITYFNRALALSVESENKDMVANMYNNLGRSYLKLGDFEQSRSYLMKALESYEGSGQRAEVAMVLANLSDISSTLGNNNLALEYLTQSTGLAENIDLKDLIKDNYLAFSEIYTSMGNFSEALKYYKNFVSIKDALYSEAIHKQISDFEVKYETEKKDNEIRLLRQKEEIQSLTIKKQRILRNSLIGGLTLLFALALVVFLSLNRRRKDNRIIANEKAKSDQLLLNILPASIASDLKEKGSTEPRLYENVTVCFTDMVGFTEKSAKLDPKVLIEELNDIFTAFDNIVEKNGCERIKTIGDSYMSLCGLPDPDPRHAEKIIRSAVEMVQYIHKKNLESQLEWQVRVGIHSGEVIAGVVGIKKYIYDVFGDTINTASRMENCSLPMRINTSESTYLLVKDKFKFEEREEAQVKGKGTMKMYFLKV